MKRVWLAGLGVLFLCLPFQVAFAQQGGFALFGHRDFEMDWLQTRDGKALRLRFLAERKILRIEALDGSGQVMLRDLAKGDVLIMFGEGRGPVFGQKSKPVLGVPISPGEAIRQAAGESCREATVNGATICLTADGIPLILNEGGNVITAQRLLRQVQNPALFTVPKDAKIQPIPGSSLPVPGAPF